MEIVINILENISKVVLVVGKIIIFSYVKYGVLIGNIVKLEDYGFFWIGYLVKDLYNETVNKE